MKTERVGIYDNVCDMMNMKTYIYILDSSIYEHTGIKFVKIGSSNNPVNRRDSLQTTIPTELKIIRIYEILNYSAYAVDEFLKVVNENKQYCGGISIENYRPEARGGKEHYIIPDLDDLERLFDKIGITYTRITNYSIFSNDEEHIVSKIDHSFVVNELWNKLKKTRQQIVLRDYQQECLDKFMSELRKNKYFQGIFYLATGLGKTFIEVCMCLEHLKLYPNDNILWITFRNDIIDGQLRTFNMFKDIFVICNHGELANINFNGLHGKVIVMLRQGLNLIDFSEQLFSGIIYDECHDASKVSIKDETCVYEGQTFEILENMRETQKLRYRIGFSATPLTENQRQNQGIIRLYGENDTVNYLYEYSLIKGVENNWLLKPIINYRIIDDAGSLTKLFDTFLTADYVNGNSEKRIQILSPYETLITKLINEIIMILDEMVIKKGIIWIPNTYMVQYMYKRLVEKNVENIELYYSTAKHDEDDEEFRDAQENCLMLACDKFKTGFDGTNMEFGINIQMNDSGHVLIQKLGRFTRPKKRQRYAYLYQFCDNKDTNTSHIVNSLVNACNGFGIKLDDLYNKIIFVEHVHNGFETNASSDNIITFGITCDKLNIDEIKAKMFLEMNGGMTEKNIRTLVRKHNANIIKNSDLELYDLIDCKSIIYTKKQLIDYLNSNKIDTNIIAGITNFVKFSIPTQTLNDIRKLFCDCREVETICIKLKIANIRDYKIHYKKNQKLPPLQLITNGLYSNKHDIFNICHIFDSITDDVSF